MSPVTIGIGLVVVAGLAWFGFARWLRRSGEARMLGNTPSQETTCSGNWCLKAGSSGVDPATEMAGAKWTIVVAWQAGCLDDDYREYLEGLADRHPGELAVVAAGLAVPASSDPRALGRVPTPPPQTWPPDGCSMRLRAMPTSVGYVSDLLQPPATYLVDSDGKLLAVWRGGMSRDQRERLATWLDGH